MSNLHHCYLSASLGIALIFIGVSTAFSGVVINEVHYHPESPYGRQLEFIELFNDSPEEVALSGWQLARGVHFTFRLGTTLGAGEYLVVAGDRRGLAEFYNLDTSKVVGDADGLLANDGEPVLLVDDFNAYVDRFEYDDTEPWPVSADGAGDSLQRVCVGDLTSKRLNWAASTPTPLAANSVAACPSPAPELFPVVINEIYYHPPKEDVILVAGDDGDTTEFVELHNFSSGTINLGDWAFSDGVDYTFPPSTMIPPGGFVVVTRDRDALLSQFDLDGVFVGEFSSGKLSNRGERLTLVDSAANVIDTVRYKDHGAFSYAADGQGHSLERILSTSIGDDPVNWVAAPAPDGFSTVSGEGSRGGALLQAVALTIDGIGEVIVDDIRVENVSDPEVNLLSNGDFDNGADGWTFGGNASQSRWEPSGGVNGSGALRLITDRACGFDGCESAGGATFSLSLPLGQTYRVTLSLKHEQGSFDFVGGLVRGAQIELPPNATPGRTNRARDTQLAPYIDHVGRFPREPLPDEPTWVTAHLRSDLPSVVTLSYRVGIDGEEQQVSMADDGLHLDGEPGDGVFGAELPPQATNTQVLHWMQAIAGGRARDFPQLKAPSRPHVEELSGYYVTDLTTLSKLPTYHILIDGLDGGNFEAVNDFLNCDGLKPASFVTEGDVYPNVGVRWRGNTACFIDKRNFKIRFNRVHPFRGLRRLNLNGLWTDKSLVRERLAWDFIEEIGLPALRREYAQLHVSGSYYGLFLDLEHPDERYLRRTGLDPGGNLYKAKEVPREFGLNPPPDPGVSEKEPGTYPESWEEETNKGGDFSDIEEFVGSMHLDGFTAPSREFWESRTYPELMIGFQLAQVVLNNFDSAIKNLFLYHDFVQDRWALLTWDMDLIVGKWFFLGAVDLAEGRQVGTLNDIMASDSPSRRIAINTWFMSTVLNNARHNWAVDYFLRAGDGYFQRAYLVRLWDLLEQKYKSDVYEGRLAEMKQTILLEQQEDFDLWGRYTSNVTGFPEDIEGNLELVLEQIDDHRSFLREYIQLNHPEIIDHDRMQFSEIFFLSVAGEDSEFIELVNTSSTEIDIDGWTIDELGFQFTKGGGNNTVIPPAGVVVVASEVPLLADTQLDPSFIFQCQQGLADGGQTLHLRDAGPGYPATIDYVSYENGGAWRRVDPGHSLQAVRTGADFDNDSPSAWVQSASVGGTPGELIPTFVRGNANNDGSLNVADPVFILAYLFQGGLEPRCLDAADADDNGSVNVADVVVILNHLFVGSPPPSTPHPELGPDPTADSLTCGG